MLLFLSEFLIDLCFPAKPQKKRFRLKITTHEELRQSITFLLADESMFAQTEFSSQDGCLWLSSSPTLQPLSNLRPFGAPFLFRRHAYSTTSNLSTTDYSVISPMPQSTVRTSLDSLHPCLGHGTSSIFTVCSACEFRYPVWMAFVLNQGRFNSLRECSRFLLALSFR